MKIELELHKHDDCLLLDSSDIYSYIGEETEADLMLAYYIDQWCQYLNHPLLTNRELLFGDTEAARLDGWIAGFNMAKKIDVERKNGVVVIHYKKHTIILNKPFQI